MPYTTTQYDTENAFDWTSIETTFNDDDSVYRIFTIFDSGLTRAETNSGFYTGNYSTVVNLDDSASQLYDWQEQRIVHDADGVLTNFEVRYDSGLYRAEAYVVGLLSTVIERDNTPGNTEPWNSILSQYADGEVFRTVTSFDNGTVATSSISNGIVTSTQLRDSADNANAWDVIQSNFDAATGELFRKSITYDDGVKRIDEYENGERVSSEFQDRDDARSWDTISIDYDLGQNTKIIMYDNGMQQTQVTLQDGQYITIQKWDGDDVFNWSQIDTIYQDGDILETQTITTYDDGSIREDYSREGVRTETRQFDNFQDDGAFAWSSIETYYDEDGDVAFRGTEFDDGVIQTEEFENGLRTYMLQDDQRGSQSYETIQTYYDMGQIAFRETNFDDGFKRTEQFENGIRSILIEDDTRGDTRNFETSQTYYDQNGALAFREVNFDNGLARQEQFEDGIRVLTSEQDLGDALSLENRDTYFDQNGLIAFRATTFDNGVERVEEFENGKRSMIEEEDRADATRWESRGTQYDSETGQIIIRGETRDNGVQILDLYEEGVRTVRISDDYADAFVWQEKSTQYTASGAREFSFIGYDNGDALIDVFDENVQDFRVEMDDDGSHSWAFRVTDYDSEGQNGQRTTFDNEADVPAEYAFVLDWIVNWEGQVTG